MSDTEQVTHPRVTHPQPAPQPIVVSVPGAAPKSTDRAPRTTRAKFKMPPPQVIAAGVLAVAALELLVWQVGGTWWGLVVNLVLLAIVAAVALVWVVGKVRGRRTSRNGGGKPAADRRAAGRNPLARLMPGGGKSGGRPTGGKNQPGGGGKGGKPGLFDRLKPGGRKTRAGAATPGTSKAPGPSRPGGSPQAKPRNPLARLLRDRKTDKPNSGGRGGSPAAGGKNGDKPTKRGGKQSPWRDLVDGFNATRDKKKQDKAKPTQPPASAKAKPEKPAKDPKPDPAAKVESATKPQQPAVDEQLVKEAVQKAAKVKPTTAATPNRGGAQMGDMNKVMAAAEDFAAALREYDPDDMHELVRQMPQLGDALTAVAGGIKHMAAHAESEWPLAGPAVEALSSIAADIRAGAGTAESARDAVKTHHETDIERGEAPRKGRAAESKWNV